LAKNIKYFANKIPIPTPANVSGRGVPFDWSRSGSKLNLLWPKLTYSIPFPHGIRYA
jgi:hypothetical protein